MTSRNLKKTLRLSLSAAAVLMLASLSYNSAMAQESGTEAVVSDFLNVYNFSADKASRLANAFPDEKYDWRPAEGIRSVKESVLHIASANYFFGSMLGIETPEGIDPQSMEQSDMNKEEILNALKESVNHIQEELKNITEEEFNTKIDFFGNEITKRQAMFILGDHMSEHLGQLIAYARMNGVVPPWSQSAN